MLEGTGVGPAKDQYPEALGRTASASLRAGSPGGSSTWDAPRTSRRWPGRPTKTAPLHLRAEENGTTWTGRERAAPPVPRAMARKVAFGRSSAPARLVTTSRAGTPGSDLVTWSSSIPRFGPGSRSCPGTARQRRARTSMAGSSWTRHRRLPSLITPTAKATLVSSTSPSGIIVTMPAHRPGHGIGEGAAGIRGQLAHGEQDGHGHDHPGDQAEEAVDAGHELGPGEAEHAGLGLQLGRVRVAAHPGSP